MRIESQSFSDHFNTPRNAGAMQAPDAVGKSSLRGRAPYTHIYLKRRGDMIEHATFETFGCGYSIVSCSVLTELVRNCAIDECFELTDGDILEALGGFPRHKQFCAQLAINALQDGLRQLANSNEEDAS